MSPLVATRALWLGRGGARASGGLILKKYHGGTGGEGPFTPPLRRPAREGPAIRTRPSSFRPSPPPGGRPHVAGPGRGRGGGGAGRGLYAYLGAGSADTRAGTGRGRGGALARAARGGGGWGRDATWTASPRPPAARTLPRGGAPSRLVWSGPVRPPPPADAPGGAGVETWGSRGATAVTDQGPQRREGSGLRPAPPGPVHLRPPPRPRGPPGRPAPPPRPVAPPRPVSAPSLGPTAESPGPIPPCPVDRTMKRPLVFPSHAANSTSESKEWTFTRATCLLVNKRDATRGTRRAT